MRRNLIIATMLVVGLATTSSAQNRVGSIYKPDRGPQGPIADKIARRSRWTARLMSDTPVVADADTGYGNPVTVYHAIQRFEEAGVAGVNIEDQVSPKRCGHMSGKDVIDMREMARKIEAACDARKDDDFVVLARTDAIAVEGIEGAIIRARLYEKAGADMIFADAIGGEEQIKRLVIAVSVPVSVNMGFGIRNRPTTPLIPVRRLAELGVRRVTLPRMLPAAALMAMENTLLLFKQSLDSGEVVDRPDLLVGIDDIWALMGQPAIRDMEARYNNLEGVLDRKSTRLNSSHTDISRMPSSA